MTLESFKDEFRLQIQDVETSLSISSNDAFIHWFCKKILDLNEDDIEEAMEIGTVATSGINLFHIDNEEEIITIGRTIYHNDLNYEVQRNEVEDFLQSIERLQTNEHRGSEIVKEISTKYNDAKSKEYKTRTLIAVTGKFSTNAKEIPWEMIKNIGYSSYDLEDLMSLVKDSPTPPLSIKFTAGELFVKYDEDKRGLIGTVKASEIVKIYEKNRYRLFSLNPRESLKKTTVNKEILKTLEDVNKRKRFWEYNNGITAICDRFSEIENGIEYQFENFKIVNGRQTTAALFDANKQDWIDDSVQIILRISETRDQKEREEISRTTNTQNQIKWSDVISSRPEQQELYLKIDRNYKGFYYEYQRGGYDNCDRQKKSTILKDGVVEKEKIARNYIAYIMLNPYDARQKSEEYIFGNHYDEIFVNRNPIDFIIPHILDKMMNMIKKKWKQQEKHDMEWYVIKAGIGKYYTLSFIGKCMTGIDSIQISSIQNKIIELFRNGNLDKIEAILTTAISQVATAIEGLVGPTNASTYEDKEVRDLLVRNNQVLSELLSQKAIILKMSKQSDPLKTQLEDILNA